MTRYDRVAGHPLAGVPRDVLTVARAAVESVATRERLDPSTLDEVDGHVADTVVMALHEEGYLTWPGRAPDREALVLAVMRVQDDYRRFQDDEDVSFAERLVDALVLPLLSRGEVSS